MINSIWMHALLPINNWKPSNCDPQHGLKTTHCWSVYLTSIDTTLTMSSYHVDGKCPSWLNVNTYLRISSLVTSETSEAVIKKPCYHNQHTTGLIDQVFSNTIPIIIDQIRVGYWYNCQTSNISHTLVGTTLVDHSNVVGASRIRAVPTTSSFSILHQVSMDWTKTNGRQVIVVVVILFPTEYKQWRTEHTSNITTTINIDDPVGGHQRSQRLIGLATNRDQNNLSFGNCFRLY